MSSLPLLINSSADDVQTGPVFDRLLHCARSSIIYPRGLILDNTAEVFRSVGTVCGGAESRLCCRLGEAPQPLCYPLTQGVWSCEGNPAGVLRHSPAEPRNPHSTENSAPGKAARLVTLGPGAMMSFSSPVPPVYEMVTVTVSTPKGRAED